MKNRAQGMTLIELMTGMLVLAILMAIAVPSFRDFASDSRTQAATSDLVTALNLARSEALRRANRVVACASTDQATCSTQRDWATGWIVFSDPNNNGLVDANELIQTWGPLQGQIAAAGNADRAVYNAMGMGQVQPGLVEVTVDVQLTGCSGDRRRHVAMSVSGSLRTTKDACT